MLRFPSPKKVVCMCQRVTFLAKHVSRSDFFRPNALWWYKLRISKLELVEGLVIAGHVLFGYMPGQVLPVTIFVIDSLSYAPLGFSFSPVIPGFHFCIRVYFCGLV